MERRDQQSDQQDAQAVIAAMHLLMRSLQPAERETLLSTWMHERREYAQVGDVEQQSDAATESVQARYPIQPLVLDSDESHEHVAHASSESHTDTESEATHEASSEGRYREKALATYASFFLPLTASFTRKRWWGYLVVSTIFMLTLSFSTLAAYRAGMAASGPSVVAFSTVSCMPSEVMLPIVKEIQIQPGGSIVGVHQAFVSQWSTVSVAKGSHAFLF